MTLNGPGPALNPHVPVAGAADTPVTLHLEMTGAEGCAVRALGVIVRRGWYLYAAELHPGRPDAPRELTVHVLQRDETRSLETLQRQLERLHDMVRVTVQAPSPANDHQETA